LDAQGQPTLFALCSHYLINVVPSSHIEFPHLSNADAVQTFAVLNPDGILLSFLKDRSGSLDDDLRQLLVAPIEFRKPILELEQLKCNRADDRISVHHIVQTIIRDNMLVAELSE